ncbi:hypothetical protein HPC49_13255 [Pyxidicoccus fallax]|uniref:Ig-like domain-containing protein n=1 Tax=Pyxidicoccus fallax TaxID=394095 RepID=A0A848LMD0_9BACT|nr:hypothetical protein [Pyxidicoccus fallax]NMO18744.1 Ig-like domain-containing protein [Pyxidicoccus fallax]NPC79201.1 hypothetical protein [Pyxidicoccus fallax]
MRFHHFVVVAGLAQSAAFLLPVLGASSAEACSPPASPPKYFTFQDSLPGNGATDVPTDGAILLTSRAWTLPGSLSDTESHFEDALSVTVKDARTGEVVPGQLRYWMGEPHGLAWTPASPLSPSRRYVVEGTLDQEVPRPGEAEGPTEIRHEFSTGARAAPPLEVLGSLQVRFESFERDKRDCTPGLCECAVVGREMATRAHVTVPAVQGGAPVGGYRVELWVTDRTPYLFDASTQPRHQVQWGVWGVNSAGASVETSFAMPENPYGGAYPPCFAWRVVDAAGHATVGEPVCLASFESASEESLVGGPTVNDPAGKEEGWGCSAGQSPRATVGTALLGLLALMAAARWRRREV